MEYGSKGDVICVVNIWFNKFIEVCVIGFLIVVVLCSMILIVVCWLWF